MRLTIEKIKDKQRKGKGLKGLKGEKERTQEGRLPNSEMVTGEKTQEREMEKGGIQRRRGQPVR